MARKSLQHQKDLLLSVISYTDNDRNAKILDPFFSEMILFFETTSKELSEDIWLELLKVFNHAMESKAIGPKEYEKSKGMLNTVYKIITQIGNHKVAALNKESICLFIELLDKFQNKSGTPSLTADNKNYNYSCLELLWSLSDNIMNNPLIFKDCDVPKLVLTKLSLSATSSDVQVRNSSLQIFSSLLSDYGQLYSDQLWVESLQSLFFRMFDDILEIYLNLRLQQGLDTNVSSPEAVSNLKSLFDEQKLKSKRCNEILT
jgi:hypothetical protein